MRITCGNPIHNIPRCATMFPKLGIGPRDAVTRQMPYARAMEMLLTGELIDARQAMEYGFINQVVPREKVMAAAERYAAIIAKNGPLAVAAVKQAVLENSGKDVPAALAREMELSIPVFLSQDAQEGPRAFKERRAPVYKGK
jgi:enoyl-CoA hydratase